MKSFALLGLMTFLFCPVFSQTTTQPDCPCSTSFREVVTAFEVNYALFHRKVTPANKEHYRTFTKILSEKAQRASSQDCFEILTSWVHFFQDKHTSIQHNRKHYETIALPDDSIKKYNARVNQPNDIEGVWQQPNYDVLIMKEPRQEKQKDRMFVGLVMSSQSKDWKRGDVKMELSPSTKEGKFDVVYYMGDHSINKTRAQIIDGMLQIDAIGEWSKKNSPVQRQSKTSLQSSGVQFTFLDDEKVVIRINSFATANAKLLDSVVQYHNDKLAKTKYWVVDLRGNSGGSDQTYFPLRRYIYTHDIQMPVIGYYLSEHNKKIFRQQRLPADSTRWTQYHNNLAYAMNHYKDTLVFIQENGKNYWVDSVTDLVPNPVKVGIWVDKQSASSAETFVLRCKQSKKVTLYGENTAGCVDGFDVTKYQVGCYNVFFPINARAHSTEEQFDGIGIKPDVYLSAGIQDPINFIFEHLQR